MPFDPQNYKKRYDSAVQKIKDSKLGTANIRLILGFDEWETRKGVGYAQRLKCLNYLFIIAGNLKKDLRQVNRSDISSFLTRVQSGKILTRAEQKYREESIDCMKALIRLFFISYLGGYLEQKVDLGITKEIPRKEIPNGISPKDVLTYEEMKAIIDSGKNIQKQALLAVAIISGARPSEYLKMTIGDVLKDNGKFGMEIQVHETKRQNGGEILRFVDLPIFSEYLRRWLAKHPARDNKSAPLWVKHAKGIGRDRVGDLRPLEYIYARRWVSEAFADSGLDKRKNNPYIFRHSIISYLWGTMGYDVAKVAKRCGTSVNMIMSRYGHLKTDDLVAESSRVFHGVEIKDNGKTMFINCPNCRMQNATSEKYCSTCGAGLTPEAIAQMQNVSDKKIEEAVIKNMMKVAGGLIRQGKYPDIDVKNQKITLLNKKDFVKNFNTWLNSQPPDARKVFKEWLGG